MAFGFADKAYLLSLVARAGWGWLRRDIAFPSPVPGNPRFRSPRDAAALIRDGAVVAASGLGGHQRASILYWAIRDVFEATGHPRDLTVVNLGGHGGRGLAPGTLEELGREGLCRRLITGHFDTFVAMLDLAAAGKCELQCIPQGTLALALDALGRGEDSWLSSTGIGTFVDPRVGPGSPVCGTSTEQLITVEGEKLRYRVPPIDVAIFNAPAADRHGNIYVRGCSMIGETRELARAARRNGGVVIANVGLLVDEGYDEVFLPPDMVDAIVYYPTAEQAGLIPHREAWSVFTPHSDMPIEDGLARVGFLNSLARVTPQRSAADLAVARLAAATLLAHVPHGARVNIGVGLAEEVPREIWQAGRLGDLTFLVESGPVGGLPAPGAYFGASLCPERIITSAEMFASCYERLDATCLGALQVDGAGNVNVSKRGDGPRGFVGPGGFIDLSTAAQTIVFVCSWMDRAAIEVAGGQVRIKRSGRAKFVRQVDQVTFHGERAVAAGKQVFYATHVGLLQLTVRGLELVQVMPGIDIEADILGATPAQILVPASGEVPVVPQSIVVGEGFASLLAHIAARKRRAQT